MSPPAARPRDELVTVLLERLDRFEATLAGMRESLARMSANEEQARENAAHAVVRLDGHEARITALERVQHRAEGAASGAAWVGKLVWAGIALAASGILALVNHFLR